MLITTAFDFPGYEILAVQGEIFGITVRARNIGAGCIAGLRSLVGGEIPAPESNRMPTPSPRSGSGRRSPASPGADRRGKMEAA